MVQREFWLDRLQHAWRARSVVWLAGVRQSRQDLPVPEPRRRSSTSTASCRERGGRWTTRRGFSASLRGQPCRPRRGAPPRQPIRAVEDRRRTTTPTCKILATGSSTLEATAKFAGHARRPSSETVWLTPMLLADVEEFGGGSGLGGLERRFLHGGLPPLLPRAASYRASEFPGVDGRLLGQGHPGALPAGAPLLLSALHRAAVHAKRRHVRGHPLRRAVRGLAPDDRQLPDGAGGDVRGSRRAPLQHPPPDGDRRGAQGVRRSTPVSSATTAASPRCARKTWVCCGSTSS